MDWLVNAFGFRETTRWLDDDGRLSHGELQVSGGGVIMLATPSPHYEAPSRHREHCAAAARCAGVTTAAKPRMAPSGGPGIPTLAPSMVAWIILWFILGYAFYSSAYAAAGALASRMEDAQSAVGPLTMVMVAGYFFKVVRPKYPPKR